MITSCFGILSCLYIFSTKSYFLVNGASDDLQNSQLRQYYGRCEDLSTKLNICANKNNLCENVLRWDLTWTEKRPSQTVPPETAEVLAIWSYPGQLPDNALDNIHLIVDEKPLRIFCFNPTECTRAITNDELKRGSRGLNSIHVEQLYARDICAGTPLEQFFVQHAYHKIMGGADYMEAVQVFTSLCAQYHFSNLFINLNLPTKATLQIFEAASLMKSYWIPSSLDISTAAYLPAKSFTAYLAIMTVASQYPCYSLPIHGDGWPLQFDLHVALSRAFTSYMTSTNRTEVLDLASLDGVITGPVRITQHISLMSYFENVNRSRLAFLNNTAVGNLGDWTQSVAAAQYLPYIDNFVDRELLRQPLSLVHSNTTLLIMNGWYASPSLWPPSPTIDPLILAVYFNIFGIKNGLNMELKKYLKMHGSVGARDLSTLHDFQSKGIDAYWSGCLTLTTQPPLPSPHKPLDKRTILIVDSILDSKALQGMIMNKSDAMATDFRRETQIMLGPAAEYQISAFHEAYARNIIIASSKLVITSRIHVGLPAVSLGVPVIFINGANVPGGNGARRLNGLTDFFHTYTYNRKTGSIQNTRDKSNLDQFDFQNPPVNPENKLRDTLRKQFREKIDHKSDLLKYSSIMYEVGVLR